MKIVIDLDGTICELKKEGQTYDEVTVNPLAVEKIKLLKEQWHYIILQTARHMESCGFNPGLVNAKIGKITFDWLDAQGIVYDEIYFWKPNADIYIDDNAQIFLWWDNIEIIESFNEKKINIVIPMAWAGSRFIDAGYDLPKPLIDVKGKPMLQRATDSFNFLKETYDLQFIFIVLKEHVQNFKIDTYIKENYENPIIIELDKITRGQAETVLQAKTYINSLNKLIIYNADTYSSYDLENFPINNKKLEGIIPCFTSNDPRYSYAKLDAYDYVSEVKEKVVISNHATNGLYYFRKGIDFVNAAEKMIEKNNLQNGEFYVGPLYNDLIKTGKRIQIAPVKENRILGTPEELQSFLQNYKN